MLDCRKASEAERPPRLDSEAKEAEPALAEPAAAPAEDAEAGVVAAAAPAMTEHHGLCVFQ